jgi:hypothetical protein
LRAAIAAKLLRYNSILRADPPFDRHPALAASSPLTT